jgi:two-component system, NarL family, nitrate/nitrite response regulator NarL
MSLHSIHEGNHALAARDESQISTVLICGNFILGEGIKHILSDTCFRVQEGAVHHPSSLSGVTEAEVILFVVEATRSSSDIAGIIRELKAQCEAARIVLLTDSLEGNFIVLAYQAGAAGVLHTGTAPEVLIKSLELIMLGESVFPAAAILSAVNGTAPLPREHQYGTTKARIDSQLPSKRRLSQREQEILCFLTQGAPNKVIARKLDVAEATVKVHIKAILRKIDVQNRTQAAMWAAQQLGSASDEIRDPAPPEIGHGVQGQAF